MSDMFCFQCEQTAGGTGCTRVGVCGKKPDVARKQDELTCALIGLARAAEGVTPAPKVDELMMQGLFATLTNVNFDPARIEDLKLQVEAEKNRLGGGADFDPDTLFHGYIDTVSLRSTLLFGLRGMAAYAWHAHLLGKDDALVTGWFYKGLRAIAVEHSLDEWLSLIMAFGQVNLKCMGLLDEAHTSTFGHPVRSRVSMKVEKGPFIVITGHDLLDVKQLLDQTAGKGINIYTHGEMLPAHGYPEFKKYYHLKGNYGTAWQNQQKEFLNLPAPVLFTTNCIMPPKESYADNIFTTAVVGYPGIRHIPEVNGKKDFSPIIKKSIELGGWTKDKQFKGINGGTELTTGFGRNAVMDVVDLVVNAVKLSAIRHIFLVGGCDGARPGRNYYTEFVRQAPSNTIVLTLACGKYRFNDLYLGEIGGLPRLLDMGQCNDSYAAIQIALALVKELRTGINELPLTLVLSWYEQKAVGILLTLLSLGIRNIYLGPTLPAFLSPNVMKVLVEKFDIKPISTPEEDLKAILKL
jgi:hydroxylamine reductase